MSHIRINSLDAVSAENLKREKLEKFKSKLNSRGQTELSNFERDVRRARQAVTQQQEQSLERYRELGQLLLDAQRWFDEKKKHGLFTDWVEVTFCFQRSWSGKLRYIARRWGDVQTLKAQVSPGDWEDLASNVTKMYSALKALEHRLPIPTKQPKRPKPQQTTPKTQVSAGERVSERPKQVPEQRRAGDSERSSEPSSTVPVRYVPRSSPEYGVSDGSGDEMARLQTENAELRAEVQRLEWNNRDLRETTEQLDNLLEFERSENKRLNAELAAVKAELAKYQQA